MWRFCSFQLWPLSFWSACASPSFEVVSYSFCKFRILSLWAWVRLHSAPWVTWPHLISHWQQTLESPTYTSFLQPPGPGPPLPPVSAVASPCSATAGLLASPLALRASLCRWDVAKPSAGGAFLTRSHKKSGDKHLSDVLNRHGRWATVEGSLLLGLHLTARSYLPTEGPIHLL